jgi:hypothetical protein
MVSRSSTRSLNGPIGRLRFLSGFGTGNHSGIGSSLVEGDVLSTIMFLKVKWVVWVVCGTSASQTLLITFSASAVKQLSEQELFMLSVCKDSSPRTNRDLFLTFIRPLAKLGLIGDFTDDYSLSRFAS